MSSSANQEKPAAPRTPAAGRADRRVKLVFLLAAAAVAGAVYLYIQRGANILPDWGQDLDAALRQARQEDRRLVVMFLSDPPGELTRQLARTTLRKSENRRAIQDARVICVKVRLDTALTGELARRHRITQLPTTVLLSPAGEELNRRVLMIGEVDFRQGFLDCLRVESSAAPSPPDRP